ncbi:MULTISPECIES: hypothetical protein [Staphylococcus]|jgi:flagellar biosynthesis chaperone FliJ|uniref:hypothetical protein n=1 Tax=Staphylococcus TaxID=1279 RepID=UPI0008A27AEE|nr:MULTISPECIES: hypothetical protein [Staphylococcus]MBC3101965.1 hypothetical protein [Staphylococcus haemolyticus]MBC3142822.1 hypothetical protein [Staphylococcus haemolyticus]MCJ0960335.1 hypothetical protein [Staphylococcus haemolyticus]OFM07494.1 hypothetical protein HMPREF2722_09230 [Staphylococcus sp. HMSC074A11]OFQ41884.1 hypothetical protein HMPREF2938_10910 [Staphylococcus sp. HMSC075F12]
MNAEAKFVSSVMDARLKKARRECDSFRKQRDELINDMAEVKRKAKAFDLIRNSYTTEIEQAIKNKELNQCLFLLEQILDDLERGSDE